MLTEEKKNRINSLTNEEMEYEISLGRRSRFQREAFAYLQTCYQAKLPETTKMPNVATDPPTDSPDKIHNPRFRISPLRIAEGVFIAIITACVFYLIKQHVGLELKP